MIEEKIIEWLDLGDSVQKIDLYERPKLIKYFQYFRSLIKYGVNSETFDIILHLIGFLQIISLSAINIDEKDDLILEVFKYFEKILSYLTNKIFELKIIIKKYKGENYANLLYYLIDIFLIQIIFMLFFR